ncbi:hypothetical protein T484DRAFT_1762599 [Baffinella frigidus]|nr:hypothetical protein T484DRAFT_1762599 [Cryptophyta sp. CCMP2293]
MRGAADSAVIRVTKALERQDWPVTVPLPIVPTALSQAMYHTATLCGTVLA